MQGGRVRKKGSSAVRPARFPHDQRMEVAFADIRFDNFRHEDGVVAALNGIRDPRFEPRPGICQDRCARERTTLEGETLDTIGLHSGRFEERGGQILLLPGKDVYRQPLRSLCQALQVAVVPQRQHDQWRDERGLRYPVDRARRQFLSERPYPMNPSARLNPLRLSGEVKDHIHHEIAS